MSILPELWKTRTVPLTVHSLPDWPCPFCGKSGLKLDFNSLKIKQTKQQFLPEDYRADEFEDNALLGVLTAISTVIERSSWIQSRFVGFLDCRKCGDSVAISGRSEVFRNSRDSGFDKPARLYPEFFSPSLPVFSLDDSYPEEVRILLLKSFSFLFSDPSSAANVVRRAIEAFLNEADIPNKQSKNKPLRLYQRIEIFEERYPEFSELLNAIRFIGNEGSHSGSVSRDDLVDSYEILDYIFEEFYLRSNVKTRIKKLSNKVSSNYR